MVVAAAEQRRHAARGEHAAGGDVGTEGNGRHGRATPATNRSCRRGRRRGGGGSRRARCGHHGAGRAVARSLLDGAYGWAGWHWRQVLDAWQWGFDPTALHLAALGEVFARLSLLQPPAATGAERDEQWQRFCTARAEVSSHLADHAIVMARGAEHGARWDLTRLRVLRLGLAARLGRELPALRDPYSGAPLRVEFEPGAIVVHPALPKFQSTRWTRR